MPFRAISNLWRLEHLALNVTKFGTSAAVKVPDRPICVKSITGFNKGCYRVFIGGRRKSILSKLRLFAGGDYSHAVPSQMEISRNAATVFS